MNPDFCVSGSSHLREVLFLNTGSFQTYNCEDGKNNDPTYGAYCGIVFEIKQQPFDIAGFSVPIHANKKAIDKCTPWQELLKHGGWQISRKQPHKASDQTDGDGYRLISEKVCQDQMQEEKHTAGKQGIHRIKQQILRCKV